MAADIAPELYEKIKKIFDEKYEKAQLRGSPISDTLKKLKSGEATFRDADLYAVEVGNMLSDSLKEVLNLDEMPDNTLYYNIAKRTIGQSLEDAYGLVSSTANEIIEEMNKKAGINLKAVKTKADAKDIKTALDKACDAKTNDQLQTALGEPVVNCVQKAADKTLNENLKFQTKAGMEVLVTRVYDHVGLRRKTKHAEVCSWCKEREGTDVPYKKAYARGMFQRHEGCGCTIDYTSRKGDKTRSTSKNSGFDKVEDPKEQETKILQNERKIDFYVGENGKTLKAEYKDWIGENKMDEYLKQTSNPLVKRYIYTDFRRTSFIGDGSTAAIRKFEKETGLNCGRNGGNHKVKVDNLISQINRALLKKMDNNDRMFLEKMKRKLEEVQG